MDEVKTTLRNNRATRKNELIGKFKSYGGSLIPDIFKSAAIVDSGMYRRTESSPVDDSRFASAVKHALRVQNNEVSLSKLSFSSITVLRNYTGRRVNPTLYSIMTSAADARISPDVQRETHTLMCASIRTRERGENALWLENWTVPHHGRWKRGTVSRRGVQGQAW